MPPVEWRVTPGLTPYADAVAEMETHAEAVAKSGAGERVWLLEHPALYTAGTSARAEDLRAPEALPVHTTGRGGQYTYHGPGQRIAYVILDLNRRGRDVRQFVWLLEEWLIRTLAAFNVRAGRRDGRVGVWVTRKEIGREDKIAAIGIRVRQWVSFHGVSLNVEPELAHYDGIVPCGIDPAAFGVTSLVDLGLPLAMHDVDIALRAAFEEVFGPTVEVAE
ncbi:MAG: lipoyl(octanoyl) transferase LipB [Pseudomonadota bacterium]